MRSCDILGWVKLQETINLIIFPNCVSISIAAITIDHQKRDAA